MTLRRSAGYRNWRSGAPAYTPFISTWRTTNTSTGSSTSSQVRLPLTAPGTYDFIADWGDGNTSHITSWNTGNTHTYSSSGDYTITITGVCDGFTFNNSGDRLKLLTISQWGTSLRFLDNTAGNTGFFYGCTNLNVTATDNPVFLGSALGMFRNCTNLVGNSSFNNWDTSLFTTLSNFFEGCTNFNQPIGNWDVSSVTVFETSFSGCTNFNQNLSPWDVGAGTSFASMFRNCTNFNNGGDSGINNWDMSSATRLGLLSGRGMFLGASAFNQPVGNWDVSGVTDMGNVFQNASAFNQNIGSWDVSSVTSFLNFMAGKTAANFSTANLDAIYNGWSALPSVQSGLAITFGTAKYTAGASAGRAILTGTYSWTITDGGI